MGTWPEGTEGVVVLPDGRRIRARGLRRPGPEGGPDPELGVYLTGRPHREPWPSWWVAWPDFRLPRTPVAALQTLHRAYQRAADVRVEIACDGGVGRTGTAIALLARLAGVPADGAVDWARAHHHPRAVETPAQRRLVRRLDLGALSDPTARMGP